MKRVIIVTVELTVDDSVEGRVTVADVKHHVRDAVSNWGGQYTPKYWSWPSHIKAKVRSLIEFDNAWHERQWRDK